VLRQPKIRNNEILKKGPVERITFTSATARPFSIYWPSGMLNKSGNTVSIELARQGRPPVGFRSSDAY
jgi:hypothetical protein